MMNSKLVKLVLIISFFTNNKKVELGFHFFCFSFEKEKLIRETKPIMNMPHKIGVNKSHSK